MKPLLLFALLAFVCGKISAAEPFRIQLDTISQGYDGKYCWAQARAAAIPRAGQPPIVVVTASPLLLTGSDV